jgi:hypothetical protein
MGTFSLEAVADAAVEAAIEARVEGFEAPVPPAVRTRSARTFERKRARPLWALRRERGSPLGAYFSGGIEIDARTDPARLSAFVEDFLCFRAALSVAPGWGSRVELKFRRLGRHRADGLYYPKERILVLDTASSSSFAHEFGHLLDFRSARESLGSRLLSGEDWFTPFHDSLLARMRAEGGGDPRLSGGRGRLSWRYFATRAECFARSFEQFVAEMVPAPSALVGAPGRYRSDPLFFRELPADLMGRFLSVLRVGPRSQA